MSTITEPPRLLRAEFALDRRHLRAVLVQVKVREGYSKFPFESAT